VDLPLQALVWASGMRWPIERCFTEGKDELGLDHYECRFWRGWHHHMTLVILAHHFLVRLQVCAPVVKCTRCWDKSAPRSAAKLR
jgi:SRSO17 transposase